MKITTYYDELLFLLTGYEGGLSPAKAKLLWNLLSTLSESTRGLGRVLVLGSGVQGGDRPVVEALALAAGAEKVVAVDRIGVQSHHPQVILDDISFQEPVMMSRST